MKHSYLLAATLIASPAAALAQGASMDPIVVTSQGAAPQANAQAQQQPVAQPQRAAYPAETRTAGDRYAARTYALTGGYGGGGYGAIPGELRYRGGPVPQGYAVEARYGRTPAFVAGAVTAGIMYGLSVIYAFAACPPGASELSCQANTGWLYVPVIGPFITAADPRATFGGRNLAIFDGVIQAVGATLLVVGIANPARFLVRDESQEYTARAERPRRRDATWSLAPVANAGATGLALSVTHF